MNRDVWYSSAHKDRFRRKIRFEFRQKNGALGQRIDVMFVPLQSVADKRKPLIRGQCLRVYSIMMIGFFSG